MQVFSRKIFLHEHWHKKCMHVNKIARFDSSAAFSRRRPSYLLFVVFTVFPAIQRPAPLKLRRNGTIQIYHYFLTLGTYNPEGVQKLNEKYINIITIIIIIIKFLVQEPCMNRHQSFHIRNMRTSLEPVSPLTGQIPTELYHLTSSTSEAMTI